MAFIKWILALFAGIIGAMVLPMVWAAVSGVIGALLDIGGVHISAATFLAMSPLFALAGFVIGIRWVMVR